MTDYLYIKKRNEIPYSGEHREEANKYQSVPLNTIFSRFFPDLKNEGAEDLYNSYASYDS